MAGYPSPLSGDSDINNTMLVIGIDFGTTFSGVAWATASDFSRGQVNHIMVWPEGRGEQGKAPTEICYDDDDENPTWGYGIPAEGDPVRWFKLLLLNNEDIPEDARDSEYLVQGRKMMKENGKTAIGFVADYLQAIWSHTLDTISKSRGDAVVKAFTFHVVITVPAIWKPYARQAMQTAADKAGITASRPAGPTTLSFVPEPEAAALATLVDQGEGVKKDDAYLICDAGGGTVDLITYKVTSVDPICLEEAVEGTGGLCGGIFVDEAFENICKKRVGSKWNRISKAGIKKILKDEWELNIKQRFKLGNPNKEYILDLPAEVFKEDAMDDMSRTPYIKHGRIHFQESHLRKAFDPAFHDIKSLIDGQITKANNKAVEVSGIILVGGLGTSPFLFDELNSLYQGTGITVLQGSGVKPRTAICKGAVYRGFLDSSGATDADASQPKLAAPIKVISTIARASYGLVCQQVFKDGEHRKEDMFIDDHDGLKYAKDQMHWYLKKGDAVLRASSSQEFYRDFTTESAFRSFSTQLKQCEDDTPPARLTASVRGLFEITWNIKKPWAELETFESCTTGQQIRRLKYVIEMIPSGASLEFVLIIDGVRHRAENAQVKFE